MSQSQEDKELSPATGRWVARAGGKIVAQGQTAEEAEKSARQNKPEESLEVIFIPNPLEQLSNPILVDILDSLPRNQEIYLVGGAVRDIFLHRETHDLDFVVPQDGIKTAKKIAQALGGAFFPLDTRTDVGRVILTNEDDFREVLDFSSYREKDLIGDLCARDFTINALAVNLRTHQLVDPVGGLADLGKKRLRACSKNSIVEDPVRIIRAVRFAAALGFSIERETRKLLKESVELLLKTSSERLRDEIFKIFDGPKPSSAIRALDILGALPYLLPEILELKGIEQPPPHVHNVWDHTLKAMDFMESFFSVLAMDFKSDAANDLMTGLLTMKLGRFRQQFQQHFTTPPGSERTNRALLFYSILYHDVAKPKKIEIENGRIRFHGHDEEGGRIAVKRAIQLRLSNAEMDRVKVIIQNHMRLVYHISRLEGEGKYPTRRAIYRFFRDTGVAGVDLCLLALADQRATHDNELTQRTWMACLDVVSLFLENWWEKREETIAPPALVNGDDLMAALNLMPGPEIGNILESIREAQAIGAIQTKAEAMALAEKILSGRPPENNP
jgi:tRNA nucleotidyltransferase/poly(A) polymerase